jgi:serpin B
MEQAEGADRPGPRSGRAIRVIGILAVVVVVALVGGVLGLRGTGTSDVNGVDLVSAAVPRGSADPASAGSAGSAIDALGVDLYHQIARADGNVVFSPTSIAFSLAMARPGARGSTAKQMDAAMRSMASDENAGWLNALDAALASRSGTFKDASGQDAAIDLRLADAAFAQKGLTILPTYLEELATRFGIGLRLADYKTDPEAARQAIDTWVSSKTDGRIPALLGPGALDAATRLVLVNAIYLKAAWSIPFNPGLTAPRPFTTSSGSLEQVPTMSSAGEIGYASGAGWQAVELPYVGGSLAMTIVVPDDLASFERSMSADTLASIAGAVAERREVYLSLPRFTIETRTDISGALQALGMTDAFSPGGADFTGITTDERLDIARVIHQADIAVGEKGTEAAAATGTVLQSVGRIADAIDVHVDRPFLFLVRDLSTGTVLFMGRVKQPLGSP